MQSSSFSGIPFVVILKSLTLLRSPQFLRRAAIAEKIKETGIIGASSKVGSKNWVEGHDGNSEEVNLQFIFIPFTELMLFRNT